MAGRNDWETPRIVFDAMAARFGPFDLDVAASAENTKCKHHLRDALKQTWTPSCRAWMNPPYSDEDGRPCVLNFLKKAHNETGNGTMTVCLLVNDTSTEWFRYAAENAATIIHLTGPRIRFEIDGKPVGTPTFSNLIAVFRPKWPDEPNGVRIEYADWRDWTPKGMDIGA